MEAIAHWHHGLTFTGSSDSGFSLPLGADPTVGGENDGFRPMELIAIGLAACTGMDVISILQKKRQAVTAFDVRILANRQAEHPKVFTHILIEYLITGKDLDPAAVERAVSLSITKYCPANAMLVQVVPIETKITILQAV